MNKQKLTRVAGTVLPIAVLLAVGYFMYREISSNLDEIKNIQLQYNFLFLSLSALCVLGFDILVLLVWKRLVNKDAGAEKLCFTEAFGIYYITSMLKYLPGKLWAYASQFYVLEKRGFRLSKILLDNLLLLVFTISTPALIALEYYLLVVLELTAELRIVLALAGLAAYGGLVLAFPKLFPLVVRLFNKVSKRGVEYSPVRLREVVYVQAVMLAAYAFYILSGAFAAAGVGFAGSIGACIEIGVICTVSMIVGFVVIIVPGGLGVQESLIYTQMHSRFSYDMTLAVPVAFRLTVLAENILRTLICLVFLRGRLDMFSRTDKNKD